MRRPHSQEIIGALALGYVIGWSLMFALAYVLLADSGADRAGRALPQHWRNQHTRSSSHARR